MQELISTLRAAGVVAGQTNDDSEGDDDPSGGKDSDEEMDMDAS